MASTKSKTGSPLQSTRQMLDELDTLMERMLALPVGDEEDLPPLPRDVPMAPTVKATLTPIAGRKGQATLDEELPAQMDDNSLLERVDHLLAETEAGSRTTSRPYSAGPRLDSSDSVAGPHFATEELPEPQAEEDELPPSTVEDTSGLRRDARRQAPPPAPTVERPVVRPVPISTRSVRPVQVPLLPLLWINQTFDACSRLLGPIGRGIRGELGRNVLGVVGLLCLGLAGFWFVFEQMAGR